MRWIKRLFCKHETRWCTDIASLFEDTSDLWPAECAKCGHVRMITGAQFVRGRDEQRRILAARGEEGRKMKWIRIIRAKMGGYSYCVRCGSMSLWFDRVLETGCESMHYVCSDCGSVQPCASKRCPWR